MTRADSHPDFILGTVQLGQSYGIANRAGMPDDATANRILEAASAARIGGLDTARAYGESEARIGAFLRTHPDAALPVITKLAPLDDVPDGDLATAARASVDASCAALGLARLETLLLHRQTVMSRGGGAAWAELKAMKSEGRIGSLGVSVQSAGELSAALEDRDVIHVQLPMNLLDWRWREAGLDRKLADRPDVTVHVRSVFLQGLLAQPDPAIYPLIASFDAAALVASLQDIVAALGRRCLADLAIAYVRAQDWVDGLVIGVETSEQLEANLALFDEPPLSRADIDRVDETLPQVPEQLLNPAMWPQR